MLETNDNFLQVGAFCDTCNQCYPIYRDIRNGTIVYENDDSGFITVITEINGSDNMSVTTTDAVLPFINFMYGKHVRGAIPFEDGRMLCIYMEPADESYRYGIQYITDYFNGEVPALRDTQIYEEYTDI